jgi:hypothetical protein
MYIYESMCMYETLIVARLMSYELCVFYLALATRYNVGLEQGRAGFR